MCVSLDICYGIDRLFLGRIRRRRSRRSRSGRGWTWCGRRNNCRCRFNHQGAQDAECPSNHGADDKGNCTNRSRDDSGIELLFGLGRLASPFFGLGRLAALWRIGHSGPLMSAEGSPPSGGATQQSRGSGCGWAVSRTSETKLTSHWDRRSEQCRHTSPAPEVVQACTSELSLRDSRKIFRCLTLLSPNSAGR